MFVDTSCSLSSFNLDLMVYADLVSAEAIDLEALREDVFRDARTKIFTTKRNLGLSDLVSANYAVKYENEISLAEDEELIEFGGTPFIESYELPDFSRWDIPDVNKLQLELEELERRNKELEDKFSGVKSNSESFVQSDSNAVTPEYPTYEGEEPQSEYLEDELFLSDMFENLEVLSEDMFDDSSDFTEVSEDVDSSETISVTDDSVSYDDDTYSEEPDIILEDDYFNSSIFEDLEIKGVSDDEDSYDEDSFDAEDDENSFDAEDDEDDFSSFDDDDDEDSYDFSSEEDEDEDFSSEDDENSDFKAEDDSDSEDSNDELSDEDDFSSDEDDFSSDDDNFSSDDYVDSEEDFSSDDEDDFSSDDEDDFSSEEDDFSSDDEAADYEDDEDSYDWSSEDTEDSEDDWVSDEDNEDDFSSDDDFSSEDEDDFSSNEDDFSSEDENVQSLNTSNIENEVDNHTSNFGDEGIKSASSASSQCEDSSNLGEKTRGVSSENSPSFNFEDSLDDDLVFTSNSDKVVPTPPVPLKLERPVENKQVSEFGSREEEPKDLREFLRKHPHCELSVVYKYFSKKEVQNALMRCQIVKKGTKLHI